MAAVLRIVYRLLHGAQQHGLQHLVVRPVGNGGQQLGVIARLRLAASRQLEAQLRQHRAESGDRIVARLIVNAEQRGLFGFLHEARGGDIGEDHALFDKLVGVVALGLLNAFDAALGVKDEFRFFSFKRDPAALGAGAVQHFVEVVQLLNMLDQRRVLLAQLPVALQHVPDFGIGQARVGAHHRFIEFVAGQPAFRRNGHLADHAQPVHLRIQGTKAVGEHLRQHRHHLRREVHRGAAAAGFGIQRRIRAHVVADVGNGHPQAPAAAALLLAVHRVVKVAGVFAVNGHQRQLAQIDAAHFRLFRHLLAQRGDLFLHFRRPDVGDFVGAQGHIHGHAGAHIIAEHFHNFANGLGAAGRALGQFDHHHEAHPRAHYRFRRHQDIKAQAAVVRHHKADAGVGKVAADDLTGARLEHAYYAGFAAAFTICAQRLGEDHIAVHAHLHLLAGEIKIVLAPLDAQEAKAVPVADDHALQQVETLRQGVALAAGKHQLSVALHGAQAAAQGFLLLIAFYLQRYRQLIAADRFFTFRDKIEDKFPARDRVRVFFCFALLERIL